MPESDDLFVLSPEEESLLRKHMRFYRALETGTRKPTTEIQKHFIQVTRGLAAAETVHERAYVKHMRLRAAQRSANQSEIVRNPEDGPTPDWFSREDWYRLRGRQRSDTRGD